MITLQRIRKIEKVIGESSKRMPHIVLVREKDNQYTNEDGTPWIKPGDWDDSQDMMIILTNYKKEKI